MKIYKEKKHDRFITSVFYTNNTTLLVIYTCYVFYIQNYSSISAYKAQENKKKNHTTG